ncbi:MAG TPA: acetylxylan esterase, partial [Candidatus Limnocylindrales bacterium]
MPQSDFPLDELRRYSPTIAVPADLDRFWADTLADARRHPLAATFEPIDNGLRVISSFDVTFAGFGGSPIRAWLHLPADRPG